MADDKESTITAPATTAAPASDAPITPNPTESAVATTVTAPVTEVTTDIPKVSADQAPADAAMNATGKTETPTPPVTESILGDTKEVKADEKKDAKPEGEKVPETKAETPTEAPKVELPVYEQFKFPENFTLDKEPLDAFTKILGEIETGKLDHVGMQAKGQALIDLASKATADSINRLNDYYVSIHENQKKEWFENFKKDSEMGGEKLNETVGMLRESVETYGGDAKQVSEFRQLMKETGVGNHPALTRILYNMQKKIDSYTKETNDRAVPAQAPAPSKQKPYNTFYSSNNG